MRIALALFIALAAAGCGDQTLPTAPTVNVTVTVPGPSLSSRDLLLLDAATAHTSNVVWGEKCSARVESKGNPHCGR